MKRNYCAPEFEVIKINSADIICTSVSFGEGNTDMMHAPGRGGNYEEW